MMLFSETETAKQNQKFPFHSFFRFAAEGWGEETRKQCKEIFGFCTRESASVSEAHLSASPRNRGVHFNPKPPRAPRVRCSPHQDFARNTFELCSTDTARQRIVPLWHYFCFWNVGDEIRTGKGRKTGVFCKRRAGRSPLRTVGSQKKAKLSCSISPSPHIVKELLRALLFLLKVA